MLKVALSESGDWAPVNAYAFVLYDTGEVILQRNRWKPVAQFFSVRLSSDETQALVESLRVPDLLRLNGSYNLADAASDQGSYRIDVVDPQTNVVHTAVLYGWLPASGTALPIEEAPPPPAFLRAFQLMSSYSHPRESPWVPPFLDITVYDRSGTGGCPWPADWADLDSPGSQRLQGGSKIGLIREAGSRLAEVQRFLEHCEFNVDLRGRHVQLQLRVNLPHQVETR